MSGIDAIGTGTPSTRPARAGSRRAEGDWRVGLAGPADAPHVAEAVGALLRELGADPPPAESLEDTARVLIHDPSAGAVLIASTDDAMIGVLGASWQTAMHVPGRYGLIQDLWVHPSWRSRAVGRSLLDAFVAHARREGIALIEVGLPRESFAGIRATEAFYRRCGFAPVGIRMRWRLS